MLPLKQNIWENIWKFKTQGTVISLTHQWIILQITIICIITSFFILFLFVKYYVSCSLKLSLFLIYFLFENVVLSLGEHFIYGTETMICHLKRQGMEVGVWDGNTGLTISLTQFLLTKPLTYFLNFLLSKWYIEFLPRSWLVRHCAAPAPGRRPIGGRPEFALAQASCIFRHFHNQHF